MAIPQIDDVEPEAGVSEFGARLAKVAEFLGSQSEAAKAAGVSLSQYKRYIAGQNEPAFRSIYELAIAANVSLDWLATGRGEMLREQLPPGAISRDLVITMLKTLDRFCERKHLVLNADERARLFTGLYHFAENEIASGRQPDFAGMLDFFYNARA